MLKNLNKKFLLFFIGIILLVLFLLLRYSYLKNDSLKRICTKDEQEEMPLMELFSDENVKKYLDKNQYVHKPTTIREDKEERKNRTNFLHPENMGEDFTFFTKRILLEKLEKGEKIEQRKAANTLWEKFGTSTDKLTEHEQNQIAKCVEGYLVRIGSDFEENFMQIQRLWHLAAPALLENITNSDAMVSENASRLLSVMKTPFIIEQLIRKSNQAATDFEIRKYVFALQYMRINNPYFLENRKRMTDKECEQYYHEHVVPQIALLNQKLAAMEKK